MSLPGFTAAQALKSSTNDWKLHIVVDWKDPDSTQTMQQLVIPASRYCRRLLRTCLAGDDPRSFACDSWLILC
jgi:hypothetical protein